MKRQRRPSWLRDKVVIVTGAAGGMAARRMPGIPEDASPRRRKAVPVVAIAQLAVAFGIAAFWAAFFTVGVADIADARLKTVYLAFETAFPVADAFLAFVLAAGGLATIKGRASGALYSLMGGSALIFLGLLDVTFNWRQGIYLLGVSEAVTNGLINAVCLGFGTVLVRSVWKSRGERPFGRD